MVGYIHTYTRSRARPISVKLIPCGYQRPLHHHPRLVSSVNYNIKVCSKCNNKKIIGYSSFLDLFQSNNNQICRAIA